MQTDDEIISVVSAHKEGKKIQCKMPSGERWWPMDGATRWDFHNYDYRVAPEPVSTATKLQPREWTLAIDTSTGHVFRATENKSNPPSFENELVHVREVLE